jgi:Protoglobin
MIDERPRIPGYDIGKDNVAKSPIGMAEWEDLKKSALFGEEDIVYLRLSENVLADQVPELLKIWRGIVFDHPHLRAYDEDPRTHKVDTEYAQAVAKRFGQWVIDTARAKYDESWLDYQYEIRPAAPSQQEEQDRQWAYSQSHPRARSAGVLRGHRRADAPVSCSEGAPAGVGQSHVRRLDEVDDPAGNALDPALRPGRRLLSPRA